MTRSTGDQRLLNDAAALRHRYVGCDGYGIAYGSHATADRPSDSDLDLVLIAPTKVRRRQLPQLVTDVLALHDEHGLRADMEVDYHAKLHATFADVDAALRLECFNRDSSGHPDVSRVVPEPWFLNSRPFALRLLLNALTSPHLFLGGNAATYDRHRQCAEQSLATLALSLSGPPDTTSLDQVLDAIAPHHGVNYKDFLGYRHDRHLASTLRRGMGALERRGVVRDVDGTRFEVNRTAYSRLLRRLSPACTATASC